MPPYRRPIAKTLLSRLRQPRRFIQVLAGPRQTGKTILVRQVIAELGFPTHYASADEPTLRDRAWIEEQWEVGRVEAGKARRGGALLAIDEIQKVAGWSETVKRLWDRDGAERIPLKVVLLGSSPLLVRRGLTESLAGRFELVRVPHWTFAEMREAFGWSLDRFLYFGGYPGAAALIRDRNRWARYILDSLVETTVSRDVLLLTRVDKPALLRRLFALGCDYSGQVLSYQKMLGQLHEAGNTTTLAHYLELLSGAGMLTGLPKFSGRRVRQRGSSPKLLALNTALVTAPSHLDFEAAREDREFWGRLVETAVGAHLANGAPEANGEVFYWRERNREVDFVVRAGRKLVAIEVKGGRRRMDLPGMETFGRAYRPDRSLLVGGDGIQVEDFLLRPAAHWVV